MREKTLYIFAYILIILYLVATIIGIILYLFFTFLVFSIYLNIISLIVGIPPALLTWGSIKIWEEESIWREKKTGKKEFHLTHRKIFNILMLILFYFVYTYFLMILLFYVMLKYLMY